MRSRMHPGYAVFFLALGAGMTSMLGICGAAGRVAAGKPAPWAWLTLTLGITIVLLALAAHKAERLTDRALYFPIMSDATAFRDLIAREIWRYQELNEQFGLEFDDVAGDGGMACDLAKRMCVDEAELIRVAIMQSPMKEFRC